MGAPGVFTKLQNETVIISKQAFDELDNLKNAPADATDEEQRRSFEAREAFRVLDLVRVNIIEPAPTSVAEQYQLSVRPDDQIIASYLHYRDSQNEKVLFLTLDRGAKIIANAANLESVEFDIDQFNKVRRKEQNKQGTYSPAMQRDLNPIQRFFLGLKNLYDNITLVVQFSIGIIVVLAIIVGVIGAIIK